jgi:hypothetical protein
MRRGRSPGVPQWANQLHQLALEVAWRCLKTVTVGSQLGSQIALESLLSERAKMASNGLLPTAPRWFAWTSPGGLSKREAFAAPPANSAPGEGQGRWSDECLQHAD